MPTFQFADKLGAGKAVSHEGFEGLEWSVPGQRIEMRVDTRRDDGADPRMMVLENAVRELRAAHPWPANGGPR